MPSLAPRLVHTSVGVVIGALVAGGGYAIASTSGAHHQPADHAVVRPAVEPAVQVKKAAAQASEGVRSVTRRAESSERSASIRTSTNGVIYACVSNATHVMTLRTSSASKCGAGRTAMQWNVKGSTGARGAVGATGSAGATGQAGADGKNATSTAWGEVWPGATGTTITNPVLANGSGNVTVFSGGTGAATLYITGCTSEGLKEPAVTVSANDDANDPSQPLSHGDVGLTTMGANVYSWSEETTGSYAGDLKVIVSTFNTSSGQSVDLDFSFIVDC